MRSSVSSLLFAAAFAAVATAHPIAHGDGAHVEARALPGEWFQDEAHPVNALFRRQLDLPKAGTPAPETPAPGTPAPETPAPESSRRTLSVPRQSASRINRRASLCSTRLVIENLWSWIVRFMAETLRWAQKTRRLLASSRAPPAGARAALVDGPTLPVDIRAVVI
ncbi:hypothetical protein AURDEDRAFT_159305 [Auricularia subglabra TFB-10046 SS5]|uniref:Uncharacterized protein n=1 Tax=Auricularia subglabra (strain TFB-10046 / SS5) TaxID=717982 RepID=J0CRW5_AURST|nr:hypothetical protein AURDEDRAFT_177935 [Auricularia subglabra TFB-10046 SS5]EJD51568.1 hypothetical protein AURDEDRAFT_159305 [Auricularia subglabra TFB-10046 SS5]